MIGPRQLIHAQALVLTALLLLPACSTRRPIVSDPPDVRTEAQVRGQASGSPEVQRTHLNGQASALETKACRLGLFFGAGAKNKNRMMTMAI